MTRLRPVVLTVGVLFGAAALALTGLHQLSLPAQGAAAEAASYVRVEIVRRVNVSDSIVATGVTQPDHESVLAFKTPGVIRNIAVNAGDHVKKGQVLAELDPRDLDSAMRQAVDAHDRAVRDLARYEKLHKDGFVAENVYDDARTLESTTRAAAAAAQANRLYGVLTAPDDGTVLSRSAEPAAVVAAGSPILAISNETMSDVLRTGIADRDVLNLQLTDPAEIRFSALPGRVFVASVSEIGRQADARTGVFAVKLAIAAGQGRLPAGLIGEARISPVSHARRVTAIPALALVEANGTDGEVVVADRAKSIAHHRHIVVGGVFDNFIEVSSGLRPGEYVVTEGATWLDDGQRFTVSP